MRQKKSTVTKIQDSHLENVKKNLQIIKPFRQMKQIAVSSELDAFVKASMSYSKNFLILIIHDMASSPKKYHDYPVSMITIAAEKVKSPILGIKCDFDNAFLSYSDSLKKMGTAYGFLVMLISSLGLQLSVERKCYEVHYIDKIIFSRYLNQSK